MALKADVVVVGAGNAALCAALAAREQGASVTVLERAGEDERGGNSRFAQGAFRFAYDGLEDVRALIPDLSHEELANTDFGTYTEDTYFDDMARVTEHRSDPDLVELLMPSLPKRRMVVAAATLELAGAAVSIITWASVFTASGA